MITASEAVLTAAGLIGLGASRQPPEPEAHRVPETRAPASADLLAPGEPYFEAVAAALRRTGYLDS